MSGSLTGSTSSSGPSVVGEGRTRWVVFGVLSLGMLMIALDGTAVAVALPTIRDDLDFSESSLAWVVNAYWLTYGGFLLLCGRAGDLLGRRRILLSGLGLFTVASLGCGLSSSQEMLIASRAVQGLGGAAIEAVGFAQIMMMFPKPGERAKAFAGFSAIAAGGGTLGVLVGGVLTDLAGWHWIFLINVPIGVVALVVLARLLPAVGSPVTPGSIDVAGALTVTGGLIVASYAISDGNEAGWGTPQTIWLFAAAAALLVAFLVIERRARQPLVPPGIFRTRGFTAGSIVGMLFGVGRVAGYVPAALYLQYVQGYDPLQVGLAYIPWTVIWGVAALGLAGPLAARFGFRWPATVGLTLFAAGLLLFVRLPVDASFTADILPGMLLQGLGAGIAYTPITLGAMHNVRRDQSGLAAGLFTTMFMLSAAVGLAALIAIADLWSDHLRQAGHDELSALTGGYQAAFGIAAAAVLIGAVIALIGFRESAPASTAAEVAGPR